MIGQPTKKTSNSKELGSKNTLGEESMLGGQGFVWYGQDMAKEPLKDKLRQASRLWLGGMVCVWREARLQGLVESFASWCGMPSDQMKL